MRSPATPQTCVRSGSSASQAGGARRGAAGRRRGGRRRRRRRRGRRATAAVTRRRRRASARPRPLPRHHVAKPAVKASPAPIVSTTATGATGTVDDAGRASRPSSPSRRSSRARRARRRSSSSPAAAADATPGRSHAQVLVARLDDVGARQHAPQPGRRSRRGRRSIVGRQLTSTTTSTSAAHAEHDRLDRRRHRLEHEAEPAGHEHVDAGRQRHRRQRRRARALGVEAVRRRAGGVELGDGQRRRALGALQQHVGDAGRRRARRRAAGRSRPSRQRASRAVGAPSRAQPRATLYGAPPAAASIGPHAGTTRSTSASPATTITSGHVAHARRRWNVRLTGTAATGTRVPPTAVRSSQMDGDSMDTLSDAIRRLQADGYDGNWFANADHDAASATSPARSRPGRRADRPHPALRGPVRSRRHDDPVRPAHAVGAEGHLLAPRSAPTRRPRTPTSSPACSTGPPTGRSTH